MKYVSTRGGDEAPNFEAVVMAGLAKDGGLFVPTSFPQFSAKDLKAFSRYSYVQLAYEIIAPFVSGDINEKDLRNILKETYNADVFGSRDVAPIKTLGEGQYLMELFNGPTLAFKDFALQFLGRVFDHFLARSRKKINILGATSGDTGSAAIAGCMGRENVNIFILHPHGKVSDVQRRQMTTINASNVHNIAVEGSFDDCQNLVKTIFEDLEFKAKYNLSAVNSINWGRVLAQIVYYFYAALKFDKPMNFSVPTGNFGNILAGYYAKKMGLPMGKLIIATNKNDILHRFIQTGVYKTDQVYPTISPSMDIQISSNFERLLAEYLSAAELSQKISDLKTTGEFSVSADVLAKIKEIFVSNRADDALIKQVISETKNSCGEVVDPHTAIGVFAARGFEPAITLATAHPAKFPDAVEAACGVRPALPASLADLFEREEKFVVKQNDKAQIMAEIVASQA